MAQTWRADKLIEAFEVYQEPDESMAVHEAICTVMVSFVCTCRPVLVHAPARA